MRFVAQRAPARFVAFAVNVMGVTPAGSDAETIRLGREKFVEWLRTMGMPVTLEALGAAECPIDALARHCCRKGPVGRLAALGEADVKTILEGAMR